MEQLVARWAHNPKVAGSSPAPATQKKGSYMKMWLPFLFLSNTESVYDNIGSHTKPVD